MNTQTKSMIAQIIRYSIPAVLEFSLQTIVGYVDLIMVGKLGVSATAAIGLTSEVRFLLTSAVYAVGIGVLAYISSEVGAGFSAQVHGATVQAMILAVIAGTVTMGIAVGISSVLPVWLGAEPALRESAAQYFRIVSLPYIFYALNSILGSAIKAAGDMKTPLLVNGIMNLCNILWNFVLIYPSRKTAFGGHSIVIPGAGWGVNGAAAATALSLVLGGILMLAAAWKNPILRPHRGDWRLDHMVFGQCVSIGIPAMLQRSTSCIGRVLFAALVTQLGTVLYASHTLAMTAESAFYIPCVGMSSAVAVLAGNVHGEGNLKKLDQVSFWTSAIAAAVMGLMSILMFLFADHVIRWMTEDAVALEVAPKLLRIVALNEPILAVSFVMESVFQGAGDTKSPFWISTGTMWVIRVFGTWLWLFRLGGGIEAAWYCMIANNIMRGLLLVIRYFMCRTRLITPAGNLN